MLLKLHIKNNFLTGKNRTRCSQNNKPPCITRHALLTYKQKGDCTAMYSLLFCIIH